MKVVVVGQSRQMDGVGLPEVEFVPDSAVYPASKPVFLPEWAGRWEVRFYATARIDRLGKSIEQRFAQRYWAEWTIAARMVLTDADPALTSLAVGADMSWIAGAWLPATPERLRQVTMESTVGSPMACELDMDTEAAFDRHIARVSRLMTLKTGDQLATWQLPLTVSAAPDTTTVVAVDGQEILKLRIK